MATCPNGHDSADSEFCEVCGLAMDAAPAPAASTGTAAPPAAAPTPAGTPCPACGTPLDGRFCEACGHDSLAAPPPSTVEPKAPEPEAPAPEERPREWTATVSADRAYYNAVMAIGGPDAGGITFPAFCPDRYFPLRGKQITIGRRSASRGVNPDIDLTGPPEDPGVSHLHAVLVTEPDGSLSIVDLDSSNGTTVNDDATPLRPHVPRALADGDRIHLGAWTTITVARTDA
ncbi:MAG TPA: FHA domain-containing protein [Actinophytocola sp.]|uniref:FHA domain-containing protein n=1 Tax=Actinophytocola sp. TaxID=1872138 RepID=UPI002DDD0FAE|nr:FHA domain-containing protein [Actinophytocola sp.]HEV2784265.1 FHA domain-containing protein [Actinophytocola sp.]